MKFKSVRRNPFFIGLIILTAAFVYSQLPRFFPNQHQPSEDDIYNDSYDASEELGIWHGDKALSYKIPEPKIEPPETILGDSTTSKHIEVDLTNQRVYAFENGNKVFDFIMSSGLYDWTPRGEFNIWIKLRASKMSGGSQALGTYYYLPNVPYIMYFSNNEVAASRGFSLHGTYWHNDFGRPKSHGCVNMRTEDVEKLYYWAQPDLQGKSSIHSSADNPGTKIIIYGKWQGPDVW